jgi:hypothetical protein
MGTIAVGLVGLAAAGCTATAPLAGPGVPGPDGGSQASGPLADFCAQWMQARERHDADYDKGLSTLPSPSLAAQPFGCPRLLASVRAGRVAFDPAKAEGCLQSPSLVESSGQYDPASCDAFTGLVPLGGACRTFAIASECAGPASCVPDGPGSCSGTCVAQGAKGHPCHQAAECLGTLTCDPTGHCAPTDYIAQDQPCGTTDAGYQCGLGLYCAATSPTAGGDSFCRVLTAVGKSCTGAAECGGNATCKGLPGAAHCVSWQDPSAFACVAGDLTCPAPSWCTSAGTCAFNPVFDGESCASVGGEKPTCAYRSICDAVTQTCLAQKMPGEACGNGPDSICGYDQSARCDASTKTCVVCM